MSREGYLILAISILAALLVIFVVTFIIYRRTPAPKGCEDLKADDEKCATCSQSECHFYQTRGEKK